MFATNIVKIRAAIMINVNFDLVSRFRIQLIASLVLHQESVESEIPKILIAVRVPEKVAVPESVADA